MGSKASRDKPDIVVTCSGEYTACGIRRRRIVPIDLTDVSYLTAVGKPV